MQRSDALIRFLFFLAGIPFLYYVITSRPPDWIYYLSLALIFAGMIYNLVSDWKKGKQAQVKRRLLMYGLFIVLLLLFVAFGR